MDYLRMPRVLPLAHLVKRCLPVARLSRGGPRQYPAEEGGVRPRPFAPRTTSENDDPADRSVRGPVARLLLADAPQPGLPGAAAAGGRRLRRGHRGGSGPGPRQAGLPVDRAGPGRLRRVAGDTRLPATAAAQRVPGQVLLRAPARPRTAPGVAARVPGRGRTGPGRPAGHGGGAQRTPRRALLAARGAARRAHPAGAAAVDRRRGAGAGGHAHHHRSAGAHRPVNRRLAPHVLGRLLVGRGFERGGGVLEPGGDDGGFQGVWVPDIGRLTRPARTRGWILIPSVAKTASNAAVNFVSRSRIRNRYRPARSPRSMSRFRACCATRCSTGCGVTPSRCTRRVASSMTNSTYSRRSNTVSTVKKSTASTLWAWACRNCRSTTPCT